MFINMCLLWKLDCQLKNSFQSLLRVNHFKSKCWFGRFYNRQCAPLDPQKIAAGRDCCSLRLWDSCLSPCLPMAGRCQRCVQHQRLCSPHSPVSGWHACFPGWCPWTTAKQIDVHQQQMNPANGQEDIRITGSAEARDEGRWQPIGLTGEETWYYCHLLKQDLVAWGCNKAVGTMMAGVCSLATTLGHSPRNTAISVPFLQWIITMTSVFNHFFSHLPTAFLVISSKATSMRYMGQILREQFCLFSTCFSLKYSLTYLFGA